MLYITTTLEHIEHDSSSPLITVGETTYYALTPSIWAWVIQSTRRAISARDRGEVNSDLVEGLLARGRELKGRIPEFDPEELKREMGKTQRLPSVCSGRLNSSERHGGGGDQTLFPDESTIDAIAERAYLDEPIWSDRQPFNSVVRESVILRLEGFPPKAFSPDEVAALDTILDGIRARRAAIAAKEEAGERKRKGPKQRTMEVMKEGET